MIKLRDDELAHNLAALRALFVDETGADPTILTRVENEITRDEWATAVKDPKVVDKLSIVGLPTEDANGIFEVVSPDGDKMPVEDFVTSVVRLKGESKARDLLELRNFLDNRVARQLDMLNYRPQLADREALLKAVVMEVGGLPEDAQARSGGPTLSRAQFERVMKSRRFQKVWRSMGWQLEEALDIFDALGIGAPVGEPVGANEFVEAALRMRGTARAKDAVALKLQVSAVGDQLEKVFSVVLRIDQTLNAPPFRRACDNLKEREEKVFRWERELQHREKRVAGNMMEFPPAAQGPEASAGRGPFSTCATMYSSTASDSIKVENGRSSGGPSEI